MGYSKGLRYFLLLASLLCIGVFSGCGSDVLILNLAVSGGVGTFDPQFAQNSTSILVAANVFEPLLVEDPEGQLHPGVAESYTLSPDGRTYTFTLREDARWSDGSSVTAGDFEFALKRLFERESTSPYAENLSSLRNARSILAGGLDSRSLGVRAAGEYTLIVELEQRDSSVLSVLAKWYCAPCKQSFFQEQRGKYGLGMDTTLYNGPFVVSMMESGKQLRLRQNPHYASERGTQLYGVNIALNSPDPAAAFAAGENCVLRLREGEEVPKNARLIGVEDTTYLLLFNTQRSLLGNEDIRLALCAAIDRQAVQEAPLDGARQITQNIIPPSAMLHTRPYREQAGALSALSLPDPRGTFRGALDSEGAQKLPFTELIAPDTLTERRAGGMVQGCWQNTLSASINLMPLEQQELMQRVAAGEYDIALIPIKSGENPLELLGDFAPEEDRYNTGWQSEEYAQALAAARQESNTARLARDIRLAEQMLADSGVVYPLYSGASYYAVDSSLKEVWLYSGSGAIYFKYVQKQ